MAGAEPYTPLLAAQCHRTTSPGSGCVCSRPVVLLTSTRAHSRSAVVAPTSGPCSYAKADRRIGFLVHSCRPSSVSAAWCRCACTRVCCTLLPFGLGARHARSSNECLPRRCCCTVSASSLAFASLCRRCPQHICEMGHFRAPPGVLVALPRTTTHAHWLGNVFVAATRVPMHFARCSLRSPCRDLRVALTCALS